MGVPVGVAVLVGVGVSVSVGVAGAVPVGVTVGVSVGVLVGVGVDVWVGVGVNEAWKSWNVIPVEPTASEYLISGHLGTLALPHEDTGIKKLSMLGAWPLGAFVTSGKM